MIFVLDNYDSFTYNLVQGLGHFTRDIVVYRNDKISVEEIAALNPRGVVISPGPGRPEHAGISVPLIRTLGPVIPVLGVCLGHQAIGFAFGAAITYAPSLVHGKASQIYHSGGDLYRDIPSPFEAARYHSLVLSPSSVPSDLAITAKTADGVIMGVRHNVFPIDGVQFHPESILTKHGLQLLNNWMESRVCR